MLAAGLSVSALALSGCAPGDFGDGGSASEDSTTLKVWSWQAASSTDWESVFDVYEEANPGVTVEFEGFQATEYNQLLSTGLAGRDGPDVAMIRAYGGAQGPIQADQLVPIDDVEEFGCVVEADLIEPAAGHRDGVMMQTYQRVQGVR